jgi:hypothetical protein
VEVLSRGRVHGGSQKIEERTRASDVAKRADQRRTVVAR